MKKVIFIDHEPLTIRRKNIFKISELIDYGFEIEFWDVSQLFHHGIKIVDKYDAAYVKEVNNFNNLKLLLNSADIKNSIFIIEVFNVYENRRLFKMLNDYQCFTVKLEMYATAGVNAVSTLNKIKMATPKKLVKALNNLIKTRQYSIYKHLFKVKDYNLLIKSGNDSKINIHINHPDWELYKNSIKGMRLVEKKYALFLDVFFPFHPDLLYFARSKAISPITYQKSLCDFFQKIETKYNLEVVIAAHPKSNYDSNSFEGRKIIKYQTVNLVRDAEIVFMHNTAAISFVIMYNKPLALITTNDYNKKFDQRIDMLQISKKINLPIYNIDQTDYVEFCQISQHIRKDYIYSYLTSSGIEEMKTADILCKTFSKF